MIEGPGDIVAVLDANVLYPMPLCDTLLSVAEDFLYPALYLPRWSGDILEETRRNLVADGRCTPAQALRRIQLMSEAFPEASVTDYEALNPSLSNHEGDRHVLAAAIRGGAQYIVTRNIRHFPAGSTEPYGIRAVTPDTFLLDVCGESSEPSTLSAAIIRQSQSLSRPQLTPRQVLRSPSLDIPNTSRAVEEYLEATQPHALDLSIGVLGGRSAPSPRSGSPE
jgi:hypothetical protein